MSEIFPSRPALPVGSMGRRSSGYWGMVFLVISETTVFAYLLFSYYYFSIQPHSGPWPPSGPPSLLFSGPQTATALIASLTMLWADRAARRGSRAGYLAGLALSLLLALGFVALQCLDWHHVPFAFATDSYSSFYFTLGGFHLLHAVVGVIMMAVVLLWSALGYFGPVRHVPITITAFYWYFVTVIWLAIFFTLDLTPYLA